MKCSLCKEKVEKTFLGKIKGTYVSNKVVCSECQKKIRDELRKKLPK